MRRIAFVSFVALVVLSLAAPPAFAAITPVRVLEMGGDQWYPSGNAAYLTYASNTDNRPRHYDAWAMNRTTEVRAKMNAPGTEGWAGNVQPGTDTAIYQQVDGDRSDLYTYDLVTGARAKVPRVNSKGGWEWGPRISAAWVTFFRDAYVNGRWEARVYLYNRTSGALRRLVDYPYGRTSLTPGWVGERYATWTVCDRETCRVVIYDTVTRAKRALDAPNDRPQYGGTIDETTGQVFFVRSGFGCGKDVGIWVAPLDGSTAPTKLASMPDGVEADVTGLVPNPDTLVTDLLFSRYRCARNADVDIWSLPGVIGP